MENTHSVWTNRSFRRVGIALTIYYFCAWSLITAIPLLVASRYGSGIELIGSIVFRLMPRIILAPLAVSLIERFGARLAVSFGVVAVSILNISLVFHSDLFVFQFTVFLIGVVDTVVTPGLLTIRSAVIPNGKNLEANTIFQLADRAAKIIAPPCAALLIQFFTPTGMFAVVCASQLLAAIVFFFVKESSPRGDLSAPSIDESPRWHYARRAMTLFKGKPVLLAILIPGLCYMITMGALQPFLFWLNEQKFENGPEMWTGLIAAQGFGALLGGIITAWISNKLNRGQRLLVAYLVASLLEGVSTLILVFVDDYVWAVIFLIIGGIPEMLAFAAYFSLIQRTLSSNDQTVFYAFTMPFFDIFALLGAGSGILHTSGILDLKGFWLFAASWSILPVIPFLFLSKSSRET